MESNYNTLNIHEKINGKSYFDKWDFEYFKVNGCMAFIAKGKTVFCKGSCNIPFRK